MPSLTVPSKILLSIAAQADRDYPHETCGFLLGGSRGESGRITHLYPSENSNVHNPRHYYQIDAHTYHRAEAAAMADGLTILGIYHSHPDSAPIPSDTDAKFAFPGWVYWIIPVHQGTAGEAAAWRRTDDAKSWDHVNITVEV